MPSTAEIKRVRSLREKKFRDALQLFVVEGDKLVQEALDSDFEVEALYRETEVGRDVMERMSSLSTPSPSLAVVKMPPPGSECPKLGKEGLYLALDGIRDPGNMGTMLRLADWFGVDGILASRDCVDIFNPKVVQSTMGSLFRVHFYSCDLAATLSGAVLPDSGEVPAAVFGTFLGGENIYETDLSASGARVVIIGNEANGIREEIGRLCTRRLTIPSFAVGRGPESLNAATAAAISLSEFRRAR